MLVQALMDAFDLQDLRELPGRSAPGSEAAHQTQNSQNSGDVTPGDH
ncbi:hypothetical protein [Microbispora sp. CA-102843]